MRFSFSQNFKQLIYLTLSETQRVNCIICTRKIKYKAEVTKVELTWYFSCSPPDHSPWKLNSKGSLHAEASHVNCQSASWLLGSPDQASTWSRVHPAALVRLFYATHQHAAAEGSPCVSTGQGHGTILTTLFALVQLAS